MSWRTVCQSWRTVRQDLSASQKTFFPTKNLSASQKTFFPKNLLSRTSQPAKKPSFQKTTLDQQPREIRIFTNKACIILEIHFA
jgi:hypothetical protein